ncbi:hypothetical protein SteCoe_35769 [Stentor coeruleus]|uniref:Uncharacterized protein n=1 Tax=Stentor coeruleus TaxID=5963 RepID=A0A1R2ARI5_9CILI|nr:hypothetical protein SteCoe_35769 [Stentor coeruleus]
MLTNSVNKSQTIVKNAIFQRLDTYSSTIEKENHELIFEESSIKFEIKSKYQLIIRVAILILFSIGAMLIISEVLYKQSQKTIIFNNEIFNNLMIQSTKIWQFGFFTLGALADKGPYEYSEFADLVIYPDYMNSINKTLLEIKDLQYVIEQHSIEGKISNKIADLLYFNASSYSDNENLGIFTVVNDLFDDSKNYIYAKSDLNVDSLQKYAYSVRNTAFALRNISFYSNDIMKNEVLYTCFILELFFTLMVVLLITLSICINFKHLIHEGKVLESTKSLKSIFENAQKDI